MPLLRTPVLGDCSPNLCPHILSLSRPNCKCCCTGVKASTHASGEEPSVHHHVSRLYIILSRLYIVLYVVQVQHLRMVCAASGKPRTPEACSRYRTLILRHKNSSFSLPTSYYKGMWKRQNCSYFPIIISLSFQDT